MVTEMSARTVANFLAGTILYSSARSKKCVWLVRNPACADPGTGGTAVRAPVATTNRHPQPRGRTPHVQIYKKNFGVKVPNVARSEIQRLCPHQLMLP